MLPNERLTTLSGFGLLHSAASFAFRPSNVEEILGILETARRENRQVVLRGNGRSYGDASVGAECMALDIRRMNRILSWDPTTGTVDAEAGVTLEQLWKLGIEDRRFPPVVSGTMLPTLAGALAMNIHGKNQTSVGTIGENVIEIDVVFADGTVETLLPTDKKFSVVVGSAGLFGIIVRVKFQLALLRSGMLRVLGLACHTIEDHLDYLDQYCGDAEHIVSWVDPFGRGTQLGRGQFLAAWSSDFPTAFSISEQEPSSVVMGRFSKAELWRVLRPLTNRTGIKFLSALRFLATRLKHGAPSYVSIVAFQFQLDYMPNWQRAYLPGGLRQFQCFVPRDRAASTFREILLVTQRERLEAFLGVIKKHRPDPFLVKYCGDGYSFALDFRETAKNRARLGRLFDEITDLVLNAGGGFYLAKDGTLTPSQARRSLGDGTLDELRKWKAELDPGHLFTSDLAKRLELFSV